MPEEYEYWLSKWGKIVLIIRLEGNKVLYYEGPAVDRKLKLAPPKDLQPTNWEYLNRFTDIFVKLHDPIDPVEESENPSWSKLYL